MRKHAKILVVDDEDGIRKTLKKILLKEGYSVDTAKTGAAAIEKSAANVYNLALIDIRLPDMKGTELLTSLGEKTPNIVKIIITGYPSQQNAIEALNRGADNYILKPINIEKTLSIVKTQLKRQREDEKFDQTRVKEYIETQVKQLETLTSKRK